MNIYSLSNQTWSSGTDITADLGLKPGSVVSSLGVAILKSYLHVVALVDQMPEHAILDLSTGSWTQAFTPIAPISSLAADTGAMSLHATDTQLYLALSEI